MQDDKFTIEVKTIESKSLDEFIIKAKEAEEQGFQFVKIMAGATRTVPENLLPKPPIELFR